MENHISSSCFDYEWIYFNEKIKWIIL